MIMLISSCLNTTKTAKHQLELTPTISVQNTSGGELIDGRVNIQDSINGKTNYILFDGVKVETAPAHDNWLQIEMFVSLTPEQIDDMKIYPDQVLYALDGNEIGLAVDTISIWFAEEQSGLITGFTQIDKLKQHTIPEVALSSEVNKANLTLKSLEKYLKDFDFQEETNPNETSFQEYMIYESTILDPSPRDRITLLFDKKGKLQASIHSRKLNLPQFSTYELTRGHLLTVFGELTKAEINNLKKQRNDFYNSID